MPEDKKRPGGADFYGTGLPGEVAGPDSIGAGGRGPREGPSTRCPSTSLGTSVRSGFASFTGCSVDGRGEGRTELAGGERVKGTEATSELDGGQAALAVEPTKEIPGGALSLLRVAFEAAGDEVAVGVATQLDAGDNMVEAADAGGEPAQAVKATAALARVDGLAQRPGFEEIRLLEGDGAGQAGRVASGANLLGQAHFDDVTGQAAFHQAQSPLSSEAAHSVARARGGQPGAPGEPGDGKPQAAAAFEVSVPQEVRIDGAVDDRQAQPGHETVFELFPDLCGVGFCVFHGPVPE